jgi:hypothetical protein
MIDAPTPLSSISVRNGKPIRSKVINYQGERYLKSPGSKYYIREQGRKSIHRQMWIDVHGPVPDGYHIHHKDFNPDNNTLENLEPVRYDAHEAMHRRHEAEIRVAGLVTCIQCGETFEALKPSMSMYCSRRCERQYQKEDRVCQWCGKPFRAYSWKKTKCCCKSCGQKLRNLLGNNPSPIYNGQRDEYGRFLALAGGAPLPPAEVK